MVFIHGGYWQALDSSSFSHLAGGFNAHGSDVAIPGYDLCPDITIDDIIGEMQPASREWHRLGRPLVVSGHSAGGHLAACMLAMAWRALILSLPEGLVSSGLCHLGPVRSVPLVEHLDQQRIEARRSVGQGGKPLVLEAACTRDDSMPSSAGTKARNISVRAAIIVEAWGAAGLATRFDTIPGGQPFYRHRPAGRSRLADGVAAESIGGALGSGLKPSP